MTHIPKTNKKEQAVTGFPPPPPSSVDTASYGIRTGIPPPDVNSVETTCFRLQICRATLYKLINADKIKTVKFGSRRMIPEDEIQRVAQEGF